MRPVTADTCRVDLDLARTQIVPAKGLTFDIGIHAGITEEDTRNIPMPAFTLPAQDIDTRLESPN